MALNISLPDHQVEQFKKHFPFPWAEESIPYLGITFPSKVDTLFVTNYPQMFRKLEGDLGAWSKCGLSWLGRVNMVKMNLMPRILYLVRSLHIPIPKHVLTKFQTRIIHFIWGTEGHRFSKGVLFRLKTQGGLGLPNLWWYYQVAQLAQISSVYSKGPKPAWLSMERQAVLHHMIDYLLWCPCSQWPPIMAPMLLNTLALCDTLHKQKSLVFPLKPLAHIFHNPEFIPGLNISAFTWWLNKGMFRIGHIFTSSGPLTLNDCTYKLEMANAEKVCFNQIMMFLNSIWTDKSITPKPTAYQQ